MSHCNAQRTGCSGQSPPETDLEVSLHFTNEEEAQRGSEMSPGCTAHDLFTGLSFTPELCV